MLHDTQINDLVRSVTRARATEFHLGRVVSEPAVDSQGADAVRITLIIEPSATERLSGDEAIDLLVGIQNALLEHGESRLPIVQYATEAEFREDEEAKTENEEIAEDEL